MIYTSRYHHSCWLSVAIIINSRNIIPYSRVVSRGQTLARVWPRETNSRVVKRTSLSYKRIFAVRRWFDSVIKIFFIKRTFIDMVPSNDTLESKRKLLFRLISGARTVRTSNKAHSNLIFVIKRTSLLGAPHY